MARAGTMKAPMRALAAFGAAALMTAACSFGRPLVVFDGETCRYQGPDTFRPGPTEVTFRNESGAYVALAFLALPEDEADRADALALIGQDLVITDPDSADLAGVVLAEPGEEVTQEAPLPVGSYLLDCAMFDGDRPAHAWRAAAIDVEE